MNKTASPASVLWSVPVAVEDIPDSGLHIEIEAPAATRAALAKLAAVRELPELAAVFDLTRQGEGVHVAGQVSGRVGHNCVVTLEPIESPVDEAVDHPRLHVEIFRDQFTISHEPGITIESRERSEVRPFAEKTMYFGGVQVARWAPDTGLAAAADSRRGGGVAFDGAPS